MPLQASRVHRDVHVGFDISRESTSFPSTAALSVWKTWNGFAAGALAPPPLAAAVEDAAEYGHRHDGAKHDRDVGGHRVALRAILPDFLGNVAAGLIFQLPLGIV